MATFRPPLRPLDLEVTIVSAKHLKNVNWRNGDLKPYAIFSVHSDRRLATKSDDSGSTRPVWNERFVVPLSLPLQDSILNLEIFHSQPSETPKPLVGSLQIALRDLPDPEDSTCLRTFELRRPSGRSQGKIRLKLAVCQRLPPPSPPIPDYCIPPQPGYFYSTPPPARDYRAYSSTPITSSSPPAVASPPTPPHAYPYSTYSDPYSSYYSGYYSPPLPPRPFIDRLSSYGVPSAPVDHSPYEHKPKRGGKMGFSTGVAVGAVAGALGGLALEEGLKYEEEKMAERVENELASRDDYNNYRADY